MKPSINAIIHQKTGETKRLGEYQYNLLSLLLEHAGEVLTREELTAHVWKNRVVGNNSLPNAIHALRQALGDNGKQQQIIKTIPKKGYLLDLIYLDTYFPPQEVLNTPPQVRAAAQSIGGESELIPGIATQPNDVNVLVTKSVENENLETYTIKKPRRMTNRIIISISITIILLISVMTFYFMKRVPPPTAQNPLYFEKSDKHYARKNIDFIWVRSPDDANHEENPIQQLPLSIAATLGKTNDLLIKNQAYLVIRYHPTFYSLVINFNITNHCKQNLQLVMDIRHWRQYQDQLGNIFYTEMERGLNDIPPCP